MPSEVAKSRLQELIKERDLHTHDFPEAIRQYIYGVADRQEHYRPDDSDLKDDFKEWFNTTCHPWAFKFEYDHMSNDTQGILHVYEVSDKGIVSTNKMIDYSYIADGDGPLCFLHIIDYSGKEIILDNDILERYFYKDKTDFWKMVHSIKDTISARVTSVEKFPIISLLPKGFKTCANCRGTFKSRGRLLCCSPKCEKERSTQIRLENAAIVKRVRDAAKLGE